MRSTISGLHLQTALAICERTKGEPLRQDGAVHDYLIRNAYDPALLDFIYQRFNARRESVKDLVGAILLNTVEQIDDYFEYRNESEQDRLFVRSVLAQMELKIRQIRDSA